MTLVHPRMKILFSWDWQNIGRYFFTVKTITSQYCHHML